ncbi:MAG TPA: hypothetical protein DEB10_03565 [Ruminococcaceae bacterium]|nr:hypothetical protein [Oscillospiraceae bacterium]
MMFEKHTNEQDLKSAPDQQVAFEEFERKQNRLYQKGKVIVAAIAIVNVADGILSAVIRLNLFILIVEIALSIALFSGITWVRYLFATGYALGILQFLFLLLGGTVDFSDAPQYIVLMLILMAINLASCILLFKSKSITEFMYSQRNG